MATRPSRYPENTKTLSTTLELKVHSSPLRQETLLPSLMLPPAAGVHIIRSEKAKKNAFVLRCLQWTTFIERTFSTETDQDT